jgi:hypothetical protein
MGEKKRYQVPGTKRQPVAIPRPKRLGEEWRHVSQLPGYLPQKIKLTFELLVDRDVPTAFIDALDQEFPIKIKTPTQCGIDGRNDPRIAEEAKKRRLIVLTRNHTDFFLGRMIPIDRCPGIFAIDGSPDIAAIAANMGAILRELGPHVHWDWWLKTKLKFGPVDCQLRRHERGALVARRLKIDKKRGRVWYRVL